MLVFGLVAGVWVDRLRRRPILIAADLGRAAILVSVPAAAVAGVLAMGQLYAVAALAGVLTVFFDVAYQSYLPALVVREQILEGNSKLALSSSIAEIAGPGSASHACAGSDGSCAIHALAFRVTAAPVAVACRWCLASPFPSPHG